MPLTNLIWAISGLWQSGGSVKSSNDPNSCFHFHHLRVHTATGHRAEMRI